MKLREWSHNVTTHITHFFSLLKLFMVALGTNKTLAPPYSIYLLNALLQHTDMPAPLVSINLIKLHTGNLEVWK